MTCCHYALVEGNESAFSVDTSAITFGPGVLAEAGEQLRALAARRVALFTDATLAALEPVATVRRSLEAAGLDVVVYSDVHVEPTDVSFRAAAHFARQGRFDGYVSVGGGSVIDTCKAALLYATYPAELRTYVNAPLGDARPIPGPLPPHVACPTTCGTGSECTGIAVFDDLTLKAKTGIASRRLRPSLALIDPTATRTLPSMVVAASGFDVLCHALESFTARPYTARPRPAKPSARPMSQGRNPWSDVGSLEALRLAGKYFVRAVRDAARHRGPRGPLVGGHPRRHRLRQLGRAPPARHVVLGGRSGARLQVRRLPAARAARSAWHLRHRQRAERLPRHGGDVTRAPPAGCRGPRRRREGRRAVRRGGRPLRHRRLS